MRLAPRAPGLQDGGDPPAHGPQRQGPDTLSASARPVSRTSQAEVCPYPQPENPSGSSVRNAPPDVAPGTPRIPHVPLRTQTRSAGRPRLSPVPSPRGFFALERGASASPASPSKVTELAPGLLWFYFKS